MKVVKDWNKLPREVVVCLSLKVFKTWLGTTLGNLIQLDLFWAGFGVYVLWMFLPTLIILWF